MKINSNNELVVKVLELALEKAKEQLAGMNMELESHCNEVEYYDYYNNSYEINYCEIYDVVECVLNEVFEICYEKLNGTEDDDIYEELYELAESACKKELEEHGDCKDPMDVFEKELEESEKKLTHYGDVIVLIEEELEKELEESEKELEKLEKELRELEEREKELEEELKELYDEFLKDRPF